MLKTEHSQTAVDDIPDGLEPRAADRPFIRVEAARFPV